MSDESTVLKSQILNPLFCIRNIISNYHTNLGKDFVKQDISVNEIIVMRAIQDNIIGSDSNIHISDIQNQLNVSKAAVSRMLDALEKKGYIRKDIDKENRRNLIITLTPAGKDILYCKLSKLFTLFI